MDGRPGGQAATANAVRRPAPKTIGFIGKPDISDYEAAVLAYIGKCIARLGHTLLIVPARGSARAMKEGFEAQGAKVSEVTAGVIDLADRTLVLPDVVLERRLEAVYPDIRKRDDVVFINPSQLDEWLAAMKDILNGYGIALP